MKILVVDDEQLLVKGIKFNLENEGYQVLTAYDGAAAVELARREPLDLIILDLYLVDLFIISHLHKSVVIHFLHCPLYDLRYQKTVDQHDRYQRDQIVKDKRFFIRLFYFLHIGFLPHSCKMV